MAAARPLPVGYVFGALGAMLFSLKAIFIKLAYQPGDGLGANELDTITIVALRMAFAMPVYLAIGWLAVRERKREARALPSRRAFLKAAGLGIMGYYVCSYTDFTG